MINPMWLGRDFSHREPMIPSACSIDLSTTAVPKATLTVAADQQHAAIHDFIELYDPRGVRGVYRVCSYNYQYGQTAALQLLGAIDTLSDDVYDVAAADAETKPAWQWLALILTKQTTQYWQLGVCEMVGDVKIKTNYQSLWTLMEIVRESQPGYWWVCDYTTVPWTVSLKAMPTDIVSEFRLSRNVSSAQISISDQDLCNRLVFTVSGSDGTSSVTVYDDAASQAAYGIRTRCTDIKEEDIPAGMTAAQYAAQQLAMAAQPIVTIQITGADLHQLTGDTFDKITLGSNCRAVLPALGAPIVERVVGMSWPDPLGQPESIRVTLSTEPASFTGSIAGAKKVAAAVKGRGGGGGGAAAKADKDGWAKVLTDTIDAVDGTGIAQLWQSGIQMTSHGGVRIFSLYQGMASLDSELVVTNSNITAEVTRATAAEGTLSSRIQINADGITAESTRATTAENALSGRIDVNAGKIGLVVSETSGGNVINAASIVLAINNAGSSVSISADHVNITGSNMKIGSVITADGTGAVVNASIVTATTMGATTGEFATVRTLYGGAYTNLSMRSTEVQTASGTTTIRYLGLSPVSGEGGT